MKRKEGEDRKERDDKERSIEVDYLLLCHCFLLMTKEGKIKRQKERDAERVIREKEKGTVRRKRK